MNAVCRRPSDQNALHLNWSSHWHSLLLSKVVAIFWARSSEVVQDKVTLIFFAEGVICLKVFAIALFPVQMLFILCRDLSNNQLQTTTFHGPTLLSEL